MKLKDLLAIVPPVAVVAPAFAVVSGLVLAVVVLDRMLSSDAEPPEPAPPEPSPIPPPRVLPAPPRAVAAPEPPPKPPVPPRPATVGEEPGVAPTDLREKPPEPAAPPAPAVPAIRKQRAGKRLTAADVSGAFAGIPLTRSAAVARIRSLTGCGQTAAYNALAQGGPFSARLHEDDEGRLCWKAT